MTDTQVVSGGCLCGAVRFTVSGTPLRVGLCHCSDCRQTSGSAYTMFAIWPRSSWQSSGELSTFNGRSFCPTCGSRVANLRDDEAEVMVGAIDDPPSSLIPQYELWTPRREHWMYALPWADQFMGDQPEDFGDGQPPIVEM